MRTLERAGRTPRGESFTEECAMKKVPKKVPKKKGK